MSLPNINLVVIGHKDHGKSTLIGRLLYDSKAIPELKIKEIQTELKNSGRGEFELAYILDSLEEERKGGLTIDITQMPFKSSKYFYTIIDAPGHREFIKKMLTGASQADAAILVISAKEGIEDQTKQHLYLVNILGIKQFIVALNKMDLFGYDRHIFTRRSNEIQKILRSLGFEKVPVIPISALHGDNVIADSKNMGWYKGGTLVEALDGNVIPPRSPVDKPLRGFVQDIYDVHGEKIIVCKVETGKIERGEEIILAPLGLRGSIEKIESFGDEKDRALPGESVGLVIEGVSNARRGDVISSTTEPATASKDFIAELIIFSNIEIRNGGKTMIKSGTTEVQCSVERIFEKIDSVNLTVDEKDPEVLSNGDVGKVHLRPSDAICLEPYSSFPSLGRFVIVDRNGTAGAGIVLDVNR